MTKSRAAKNYPDILDYPEHLKYLPTPNHPILHRLAWGGFALLCITAVVPLFTKFILNFIDSFIHPSSFIKAGKNLGSMFMLPLVGVPISLLSMIAPKFIGGRIVQLLILPVRYEYKLIKRTGDKRSISAEVGPNVDTNARECYGNYTILGSNLVSHYVANERVFPDVRGKDGISIDSCDLPNNDDKAKLRYRLFFQPALGIYQTRFYEIDTINNDMHCQTRVFNYPNVTKENDINSINDLVNAGIAEVYDIAKKMNWNNEEVAKRLHLFGYCLGGFIAIQVALYFKLTHGIDLVIFADRSGNSFQDLATAFFAEHTGLPQWYIHYQVKAALYGGGELNADSLTAIKQLNPEKLYCINLTSQHEHAVSKLDKLRKFLGIGYHHEPDFVIRDSDLASGLAKVNIQSGTQRIFNKLGVKDPNHVYRDFDLDDGHMVDMSSLKMQDTSQTSHDYYVQLMDAIYEENENSEFIESVGLKR